MKNEYKKKRLTNHSSNNSFEVEIEHDRNFYNNERYTADRKFDLMAPSFKYVQDQMLLFLETSCTSISLLFQGQPSEDILFWICICSFPGHRSLSTIYMNILFHHFISICDSRFFDDIEYNQF